MRAQVKEFWDFDEYKGYVNYGCSFGDSYKVRKGGDLAYKADRLRQARHLITELHGEIKKARARKKRR